MAVGRLGDRVEALDRAPADRERAARAGDVGDREAELARAAGEPLGGAVEVLVARERMKEVVELLGVVVLLAAVVCALIASARATGSGSAIGRSTFMNESRLPSSPAPSSR